jgi:hypothetical protein
VHQHLTLVVRVFTVGGSSNQGARGRGSAKGPEFVSYETRHQRHSDPDHMRD